MTKAGNDHLKKLAREIARASGRRLPDVLAELRGIPRTAPRQPSKELVLVCSGLAHPIDGGRCRRMAGHRNLDGGWGWCSWGPNDAVHIWAGYYNAESQAQWEREDARLAALTPDERAADEAEATAAYWSEMADEARELYDPYDDKYFDYDLAEQGEADREAEAEFDYETGDPYSDSYLEAR
ncbi:hypothetical protein [Streptomyces sp. NPDC051572]|uniref:hypothetical protein n=1 Tax=Streptomyces sp. NPDC051572 TaxID=3155802 RepID=UPI00344B56AE